jgi:MFS family permease
VRIISVKNVHHHMLVLALVGSLTVGTTFLMSPIAGVLNDRIGIRTTTFIGGFIATSSLLISSYFTHQVSNNIYLYLKLLSWWMKLIINSLITIGYK